CVFIIGLSEGALRKTTKYLRSAAQGNGVRTPFSDGQQKIPAIAQSPVPASAVLTRRRRN
ncbi:hypothetical protein, partial [Pantoea ananatis]|uniref:hypothetical protein n=1 Tax=Pantoea ananas TaxID=553 RepID=UPI001B302C44